VRRIFTLARALAVLVACLVLPPAALAQGGPPLVTDDPDTPGAGKWEVNYAAILRRTPGRWEVAAPDVDMNYGWGERVQLKLDIPWVFARETGEPWKSGLGNANAGVKWRFIDADHAGYSVSTYPQVAWNTLPSSARRGITDTRREFLLPIEVSKDIGEVGYDAEVGRNFVASGVSQWIAGVIVAPKCGERCEGLFEVHETYAPHEHETLLNAGLRWKLGESMSLLVAAGREFGTSADDRRHALLYLGLQVLR
jgi:hypothetical protein